MSARVPAWKEEVKSEDRLAEETFWEDLTRGIDGPGACFSSTMKMRAEIKTLTLKPRLIDSPDDLGEMPCMEKSTGPSSGDPA